MRNDQLQEYLKNFSAESDIRILIDGVYYPVEDVIQGRFFSTVELVGPQKISIEQAEGELFTGLYTGNINQKRLNLITKVLGEDRVNLIQREIDKAKAEAAAAEEAEESEYDDDKLFDSDEAKLLAYFKGDANLSPEELKRLRAVLSPEKYKEIYDQVK